MTKRRDFRRQLGERPYRKLFLIAAEGAKTEPQYFAIFNLNNEQSVIHVQCIPSGSDSAPLYVLKRMQAYLRREDLKPSDEAWLVVDKDQWPDEQLARLYVWAKEHDNYNVALSNPKFEYWLLLHFEDGTGLISSRDCIDRLKQEKNLPGYDKGIDVNKFTRQRIKEAIRRARQRDNPRCADWDWPRAFGRTTVYRLVEKIFESAPGCVSQ